MPKQPPQSNPYASFTQAEKDEYMQRCVWWRWERKRKLVDLCGGRCSRCGYDRCLRALSFHHRDPATKRFALNSWYLAGKSWDALVAEAAKCDLLCANCHMEVEHEAERKYSRFGEGPA